MEAPSKPSLVPASEEAPGPRQPKLRSTCDSCQEAKVRCSHDTPRCRRCRTHNLDCVYSVSQRMGRPRRIQAKENEAKNHKDNGRNPSNNNNNGGSDTVVAAPSSLAAAPEPDMTVTQQDVQDALVDPAWRKTGSAIVGGTDPFDSNFSSPECIDFNGGTSSSSHWPGSNLNFNSMPLWDFSGDSTSTVFSPNSLLSVNSDTIFQDVTATSDQVTCGGPSFSSELISPILESHPQSNEPQQAPHQQQHRDTPKPTQKPETRDQHQHQHQQHHSHPEPDTHTCTCYASVLEELSRLYQDRTSTDPAGRASRIDVILQAEGGVQQQAAKVLSCEGCSGDRSSLLLLLSMVIDHIVRVLGITCGSAAASPSSRRRRLHPLGGGCAGSGKAEAAAPRLSAAGGRGGTGEDLTATGSGETALPAAFNCPLLVGEQEISREDKLDLLKQLVQGRLGRLCSTLRRLRTELEENGQDLSARAGAIMVSGLQRRLQSVIGRIELWDG